MLGDVRNYTAALDFNIDIPADRGDRYSKSPRGRVSPSRGATPKEPVLSLPSSSLLAPMPTSASSPAPTSDPTPAAPKATTGHPSHYVSLHGVTPAVTRSQASKQNQTHVVTGNQENSSNTSASTVERFRPDTLSHFHELGLFSTEARDNNHQMDYRGTFSAEYTYATKHLQESRLRRRKKERIPNTLTMRQVFRKQSIGRKQQMRKN